MSTKISPAVTLILSSANMGDVTEADFNLWTTYVSKNIGKLCEFDIVVDQARYGEAGDDHVSGATEAQAESIRDAIRSMWEGAKWGAAPKSATKTTITKPMRAKLLKMTTDRRAFNAREPNTIERRLLDEGYVALQHRNGPDCQPTGADLTDAGWAAIGMHLVACDGEAHGTPHIDNCMCCAPRWGKVAIPVEYPTLSAYRNQGTNFGD